MKNTIKGIHNTYILKGKYKPFAPRPSSHITIFKKAYIFWCFLCMYATPTEVRRRLWIPWSWSYIQMVMSCHIEARIQIQVPWKSSQRS